MAYGLEVRNNSDKLTLSSDIPVIKFMGKATLVHTWKGPYMYGGNPYSWQYELRIYNIPAGVTPICFLYTSSATGYADLFQLADLGSGTWQIVCNTLGSTPPTVYVFSIGALPPSSDTHGMRIFDSAGNLQFDSGWYKGSVLQIKEMPNLTLTVGNSVSLVNTFIKPAFLCKCVYCFQQDIGTLNFTTLSSGAIQCTTTDLSVGSLTIQIGNGNYGNYTIQDNRTVPVPIIEGADYD